MIALLGTVIAVPGNLITALTVLVPPARCPVTTIPGLVPLLCEGAHLRHCIVLEIQTRR